MLVPAALVYFAFTGGGAGDTGWGIPMATDIAIALGVLSLLGSRVPPSLKLFLLALAIVDDIGAIVVIAIFYSHGLRRGSRRSPRSALLGVMFVLRRMDVRSMIPFVVVGVAFWIAIYDVGRTRRRSRASSSGCSHRRALPPGQDMIDVDALLDLSTVEAAEESVAIARESVSVVEWLEHRLHPWSSFVIVPLFALAERGRRS